MSDSKDKKDGGGVGEENVWQSILKAQSRAKNREANSTLIVLGDSQTGKTSLLNKFTDRITAPSSREYVLDFSYVHVKNKRVDKDDIVASMNVWQLDNTDHADLLPLSNLSTTVAAIVLDLSEPWNVQASLDKWLRVLQTQVDKQMAKLSDDEKLQLRTNVSKTVQLYIDPKADEKEAKTLSDEEIAKVGLDAEKPSINLGLPIIIVGTKGDSLSRQLRGADDKWEYITRSLRRTALTYGASLIYTGGATTGKPGGIELLQEYIYHRLYAFRLFTPAKVVTGNSDDFCIYVPTGYDSAQIMSSTAGVLKYSDSTPLADVFPNPSRGSKKSKASPIAAQDNATFYKTVKFNLEQQAKREAKVARPARASLTPSLTLPEPRSSSTPTSATSNIAGTGRPTSLAVPGATDRPSISPLVSPMSRGTNVGTNISGTTTNADGTETGGKSQRTTEAVQTFFASLLNREPGAKRETARATARAALGGTDTISGGTTPSSRATAAKRSAATNPLSPNGSTTPRA